MHTHTHTHIQFSKLSANSYVSTVLFNYFHDRKHDESWPVALADAHWVFPRAATLWWPCCRAVECYREQRTFPGVVDASGAFAKHKELASGWCPNWFYEVFERRHMDIWFIMEYGFFTPWNWTQSMFRDQSIISPSNHSLKECDQCRPWWFDS